ncbi:O-antigen ligase family protein [Desulfosarcina sp.]|nr:O-antigen ligase family protein [Desulfosarcina sp.]
MSKQKIKHKQKTTAKWSFMLSTYFLVIAVCFLIPFMHFDTTLDPTLFPRFTALGVSIVILAILMFFENGKKKIETGIFLNGYFIVFLFFILISIASLFSAINPIEGLSDIFKWILFFMLSLLATILMIKSESVFELLLKGVIINSILFSVFGFAQYFENAFLSADPNALYEVKGLMAHKNQFSISLFVVLPFLLSGIVVFKKTWKKLAVFSTILVFILIMILQTRAVWLGLFISGVFTIIVFIMASSKKGIIQIKGKNKKRILSGGIAVVVLILLLVVVFPVGPFKSINERVSTVFNPKYTSNEWRVEMWNATTKLVKDQPVTGVGAGNWKISVYPYYSEYLPSVYRHWRNPHNDYLLAFSEKGLLGLLAFVSIFFFLLFYGIRNLYRSSSHKAFFVNSFLIFGVAGYMLVSFFSFPNERINHLIFVSLMAAYIISEFLKPKLSTSNKGINKAWFVMPILVGSYLAIHFGVIAINSEINLKKAMAAQMKKDWKAMYFFAQKAYSKYAPIEPHNSYPVAMYSGLASFSQGKFEVALENFKKSYQQHPTSISVINNLGSVYGELGKLDSCIYYHSKTLEIFPHYDFGRVNLTKSYYVDKDYKKAYQTILHCDPKSTNKEVHQYRVAIENKLKE